MLEAGKWMDTDKIAQQVIDFQKTAFEGAYTAASFVQEQATSGVQQALEAAVWIPEENRKQIDTWLSACAQSREQFKAFVDDNFVRIESIFSPAKKTGTVRAKTKKTD